MKISKLVDSSQLYTLKWKKIKKKEIAWANQYMLKTKKKLKTIFHLVGMAE